VVVNAFTCLFFGISTTLISTRSKVYLAAFFASLFVLYFPFSSIHGRVSSIFIHTAYNFFTIVKDEKRVRVWIIKTVMNSEYEFLLRFLCLETYLKSFVSCCRV
jgi:hypothetical protein